MAGLLAARVLAERFADVVILDSDELPDAATQRRGVPQGAHAHALLVRGAQILEELFPGITEAFIASGAVAGDLGYGARFFHFGVWKLQFQSGIKSIMQSRPHLEWHVRRRVSALGNVRFAHGKVMALAASADRRTITGVLAGDGERSADLVVDASGRGSRAPQWLETLGYAGPATSEIGVDVGYASRSYQRVPDGCEPQAVIVVPEPPRERRTGAILPIEGDRWLCTLGGWFGDHPPLDDEGFLAFARTLPVPDVYDFLRRATPLGEARQHKFPASRRRHFETLERRPAQLLVVGDALCSFNPVYGQGMTVAAREALALREALADAPGSGWTTRAQRRIAREVDLPWALSAGADFAWPETTGKRSPLHKLTNAYVSRAMRLGGTDVRIVDAFNRVMHMVAPAHTLFEPAMLWRVLTQSPTPSSSSW